MLFINLSFKFSDMNSFANLPVPASMHECNPLSLRMFHKTYKEELIDGGPVVCEEIDAELKIRNKMEANWLLTKDSLFYVHPQSLTLKKFSFNTWALGSHLGLIKNKKKKNLSCIRIFEVEDPLNDRIMLHETFKKNSYINYYDFYVATGSEVNISLVNSLFLDSLEL